MLLAAIFSIFSAACSGNEKNSGITTAEYSSSSQISISSESSSDSSSEKAESQSSEESAESSEENGSQSEPSQNGGDSKKKEENKKSESDSNGKNSSSSSHSKKEESASSSSKPDKEDTQKPNNSSSSQSKEEHVKKKTCYLTIECKTILNNMENLTPGKESLVPSDGYILKKTAVEFEDGETVFDVLLRETRNRGIHMEYEFTPAFGSHYIEGINNLYEFDCGIGSGWNYFVNSSRPNYGVSQYTLSEGDNIQLCYTCDFGSDL